MLSPARSLGDDVANLKVTCYYTLIETEFKDKIKKSCQVLRQTWISRG